MRLAADCTIESLPSKSLPKKEKQREEVCWQNRPGQDSPSRNAIDPKSAMDPGKSSLFSPVTAGRWNKKLLDPWTRYIIDGDGAGMEVCMMSMLDPWGSSAGKPANEGVSGLMDQGKSRCLPDETRW